MTERRSVKRIPVTFRASFGTVSLGKHAGTICDVTLNGCLLESSVPVPLNTYLDLSIQESPTTPPIVIDLAAVRWALDRHLGLEFLSLRAEDQAKLQQIIEREDPSTE